MKFRRLENNVNIDDNSKKLIFHCNSWQLSHIQDIFVLYIRYNILLSSIFFENNKYKKTLSS